MSKFIEHSLLNHAPIFILSPSISCGTPYYNLHIPLGLGTASRMGHSSPFKAHQFEVKKSIVCFTWAL